MEHIYTSREGKELTVDPDDFKQVQVYGDLLLEQQDRVNAEVKALRKKLSKLSQEDEAFFDLPEEEQPKGLLEISTEIDQEIKAIEREIFSKLLLVYRGELIALYRALEAESIDNVRGRFVLLDEINQKRNDVIGCMDEEVETFSEKYGFIRGVEIEFSKDVIGRVLNHPDFEFVDTLVADRDSSTEELTHALNAPELQRITKLSLRGLQVDVEALGESPHLRSLRSLDLAHTLNSNFDLIDFLLDSPVAAGLEELSICGNIFRCGFEDICNADNLGNLKRLNIAGTLWVAEPGSRWPDQDNLHSLEEIVFTDEEIVAGDLEKLAQSSLFKSLKVVKFCPEQLTFETIEIEKMVELFRKRGVKFQLIEEKEDNFTPALPLRNTQNQHELYLQI